MNRAQNLLRDPKNEKKKRHGNSAVNIVYKQDQKGTLIIILLGRKKCIYVMELKLTPLLSLGGSSGLLPLNVYIVVSTRQGRALRMRSQAKHRRSDEFAKLDCLLIEKAKLSMRHNRCYIVDLQDVTSVFFLSHDKVFHGCISPILILALMERRLIVSINARCIFVCVFIVFIVVMVVVVVVVVIFWRRNLPPLFSPI